MCNFSSYETSPKLNVTMVIVRSTKYVKCHVVALVHGITIRKDNKHTYRFVILVRISFDFKSEMVSESTFLIR